MASLSGPVHVAFDTLHGLRSCDVPITGLNHTPRNRCVRFVAGVAVGSRNTRFQAACWALPGSDFHRLIAPALLGAFAESGHNRTKMAGRARRPIAAAVDMSRPGRNCALVMHL
jgi:hypothetical protein